MVDAPEILNKMTQDLNNLADSVRQTIETHTIYTETTAHVETELVKLHGALTSAVRAVSNVNYVHVPPIPKQPEPTESKDPAQ